MISEAVLGTPLALCKHRRSRAASTLGTMVPSTHHPLRTREMEAAGSDTAGRKATASQEGTEPRRHRIPSPKSTLYGTTAFRADIRKAAWGVGGETGGKEGRGGKFSFIFIYLYIKSK